MLLIICYR